MIAVPRTARPGSDVRGRGGWLAVARPATPPPLASSSMPLEVESPTKRTYWVGEGAAILLADELLALGADAIGREQRVSAFDQLRLPLNAHPDSRHARSGWPKPAAPRTSSLGTVALDEQRLSLRARVLDLDTGGYHADLVEQGAPQDLFVIARRLAKRVFADVAGGVEPASDGISPDALPGDRRRSSRT